jgi:hypothetical protein
MTRAPNTADDSAHPFRLQPIEPVENICRHADTKPASTAQLAQTLVCSPDGFVFIEPPSQFLRISAQLHDTSHSQDARRKKPDIPHDALFNATWRNQLPPKNTRFVNGNHPGP